MLKKIIAAGALLILFSCNNATENKTTENKPVENKTNNQAQIDALNTQSKQCISLMNKLEEDKTTAINAGNTDAAAAIQNSIDSAATENSKIGQKLIELQK